MENRIRSAFDAVHADEALIAATAARLRDARADEAKRRAPRPVRRYTAALAAVFCMVVGVAGFRWYAAVDSHISFDVNPSVELRVNRLDQVVGTYAFNPEGEQLLGGLRLRGKRYDDAAELLVQAMEQGGYLDGDALVSVTVQAGGQEREQLLRGTLSARIEAVEPEADVEVFVVSREVHGSAHRHHVSPARYLAVTELMEADPQATWEAYEHHTIRQIRERTQECHNAEADSGGGGSGGGRGHQYGRGQGGEPGGGHHG